MKSKIASVIVLSYKNLKYLYNAIDSVLSQSYNMIELLISDDGTKDFPLDSIINYIEKNKRNNIVSYSVNSNSINLGTVKNINNAIKRSIGEYIIILSSDDCFYNNTVVERVVQRLDKSKNGVITCRRMLCDNYLNEKRLMPTDKNIKKIKKLSTPLKQHKAFVYGQFYEMASGSCTYYTRKRLEADGLFNEDYRLLEDWTHFIEITNNLSIESAYDIISIKYRDGGVSSSIPKILLDDYLLMMNSELHRNSNNQSCFYKRYIRFNILRFRKNKFIVYFMYPDILLVRLIYKLTITINNR